MSRFIFFSNYIKNFCLFVKSFFKSRLKRSDLIVFGDDFGFEIRYFFAKFQVFFFQLFCCIQTIFIISFIKLRYGFLNGFFHRFFHKLFCYTQRLN